jgi:LmbE family N-acetylglucosaminyl deacetylase
MAVGNPNLFIDLTDKFDVKLAALREHGNQVAHMENLDELITGRLAETFRQVKLPD